MPTINFNKGIEVLQFESSEDITNKLKYIRTNTGSPYNCLFGLSDYFKAKALLAWYQDNDLYQFQQQAYSAAKVQRMYLQYTPDDWIGGYGHFMALASNSPTLIHWFSQCTGNNFRTYQKKIFRNNIGSPEYHAFQAILALQGKWQLLGERAEYILANPPGKKMLKYQLDQRFYLALAKGDITSMEQILSEFTSPKVAKVRNFEQAFSLTEHLLSTFAFIYAKIAWLHGYQVQVDSPWLPMEWLPMTPLSEYKDEFDFIAEYEVFKPFTREYEHWSPVPIGEKMIDITIDSNPGQKLP